MLPTDPSQQIERWVVDGLEDTPTGRLARLEMPNGESVDVPLDILPDGVQEGDILAVQGSPGSVVIHILNKETQAAKAAAQAKLNALNAQGAAQPGEEITL